MKIDTEGSELDILIGANKSLKKGVIKNIQLEIHHDSMRSDKSEEIEQFLIGMATNVRKHFDIILEISLKEFILYNSYLSGH